MRALLLLAALSIVACAASTESPAGRFDGITAETEVTDGGAADSGSDETTGGGIDAGARVDTAAASTSTSTCQTARDLGSLPGDAVGTLTAQGTCSEWLKVRVLETSLGAFAAPMKLQATLVSTDVDFDLSIYVDEDTDAVACTTATASSTNAVSRSDVASATWGESWMANGSDDSRTVSIEIKAKDPASCGKGKWVLLLEGDR